MPKKTLKERAQTDKTPRRTLSFYRYVRIGNPAATRDELYENFSKLGCLGRIYVASEGINAQMSVPVANWDAFDAYLQGTGEFSGTPYKIAVEETDVPSFYKLTIKVRKKIVADGLDDASFDVTKTGEYLTAEEMNAYVDDPDAVIVDMRNGYESEIGHFEKAVTPDVDTFREELQVVPKMLEAHKEKKIALYCTGGIRCEKASAWLRHLGFKDVKHLKGGIIGYKHEVDAKGLSNKFRGKNFVFDERMGERVGEEVIAHCHLCGREKCDTHRHCKNQACHVLFIGCEKCVTRKKGYCSYKCMTFDKLPRRLKKFFTRDNYKKKLEQFKKHRMRAVVR